ncbi:hypothetical protein GCM10011351_08350 [Paraliobacillus quinghaiensis]|uniref:DUF2929 family protein n=1 Tax=Paraliobacillus quinghaiensis TaxID=470815 RepID=A0A917TJS9_9BACI|nr:DUF2929 family protein [Paraliobacillus quinghaiensis]GGM24991.1 hypothetical protein GCM10011351_08350 [Paraliobacillus quinghaiensis]
MRYLGGIFWSFLISTLLGYVLTSMTGDPFSFAPVLVMTVAFSIIVAIVGDGIITPDTKKTVE